MKSITEAYSEYLSFMAANLRQQHEQAETRVQRHARQGQLTTVIDQHANDRIMLCLSEILLTSFK